MVAVADRKGWNAADRIAVGGTSIAVGVVAALTGWPAGVPGALIGAGIGMLAVGVALAVEADRR